MSRFVLACVRFEKGGFAMNADEKIRKSPKENKGATMNEG
jgi:hypothetical protein